MSHVHYRVATMRIPRAHILIWLMEKVHSNQNDNMISVQLPDQAEGKSLNEMMKADVFHGLCDEMDRNPPYMKDKMCTNRYPSGLARSTDM